MVYCTDQDIYNTYGQNNVTKWASLDGTLPAQRIVAAIESATAIVDDALRGGRYKIPFPTVPIGVRDAAAKLAGVALYEGRGINDADEETNALRIHRTDVMEWLADVRKGAKRISDAYYAATPKTFKD